MSPVSLHPVLEQSNSMSAFVSTFLDRFRPPFLCTFGLEDDILKCPVHVMGINDRQVRRTPVVL